MRGKKILVVDDEADAVGMYREMLTDEGFRVETAGSVGDATLKAEEFRPDLCLIDISLPDGNGIRLARTLGLAYGVPTIVMTGMSSYRLDGPMQLEQFVKFVLFKPIRRQTLIKTVEEALGLVPAGA